MKFLCSICQGIVSVDPSLMGTQVQCGHCSNTIAVPADRLAPGAVVGDFVIQQEIGVGGMGVVYLSHQLSLDRPAALKLLSGHYANNTEFVEGFIKEARSAAKLNHPNIVQAYAVGEDEGIFYFAMEYVDGETMKEVLARENIIPPERAIAIIEQITNALDYAWKEEHLIHRDIKPDNIMLTASGRAKLADLGLARMAEESDSEGETIMGTPQYISPEHLTGEPMDIRSDIYSLGASFYQFVTGQFPYSGTSAAEIAQQHLTGNLIPPIQINASLPAGLSEVIVKMMASHVENRYRSAEELLEDLRAVKNGTNPVYAESPQNKKHSVLPQAVPAIPVQQQPQAAQAPQAPQGLQAPRILQVPGTGAQPQAPQAPQGLQAPRILQVPGTGAQPQAPQGLQVPGTGAQPQAPQGLQIPGAGAQPQAPQGLQVPGAGAQPQAPQGLQVPGAGAQPQASPGLKAPGGLMIKKEEKKKDPPKAEEKKEGENKEKPQENKNSEKKEKKDLANPLMKERQEKAKKQKQKKLFLTLGVTFFVVILAVAAILFIGLGKVKNSVLSVYNIAAKKANLSTVELSQGQKESALKKEMTALLAELESQDLSPQARWDKCEEFMSKKPDPAPGEEEELYQKIRKYFIPADIEKCNDSRSKLHAEYMAENENIRKEQIEKRLAAERAEWEAEQKRRAERRKKENEEIAKRRRAAGERLQRKIQAAKHKEMLACRKEFYSLLYDFDTTIQEKQKSVKTLLANARKILSVPHKDPDYQEARKLLGRVTVVRPDTSKMLQEMSSLFSRQTIPFNIEKALRIGNKKFVGTSVMIRGIICKVEKVENFTIYGKLGRTVYSITLDEMAKTNFEHFRDFIREAFGRYGFGQEHFVPVFFALNGDVKTASRLGETPGVIVAPSMKNLANFYKPYFDFVLKQNRNDKAMRAKLLKDLGNTLCYKYYLNPPKAVPKRAAPRRPAVKKAPPKKAPAKKAPAKKPQAKKK